MNEQDLSSYLETNIDINLPDFILNLLIGMKKVINLQEMLS